MYITFFTKQLTYICTWYLMEMPFTLNLLMKTFNVIQFCSLTDISEIKLLGSPDDVGVSDGLCCEFKHVALLSVGRERVGYLKLECLIWELITAADPVTRLPTFTATKQGMNTETGRHLNVKMSHSSCGYFSVMWWFYLFILPVFAQPKAHKFEVSVGPLAAEDTVIRLCPASEERVYKDTQDGCKLR